MIKRICSILFMFLILTNITAFAAPKAKVNTKTTTKSTSTIVTATQPTTLTNATAPIKGKQIEAWFYNIKMTINGQAITSALEPFIYNDNVYVPLKPIVDGFGGTFSYDAATKSITILDPVSTELNNIKTKTTGLDFQINSAQAQLSIKDDKIKNLESKISDLEKQVNNLKDNSRYSSSSSSNSDIRRNLENGYDRFTDNSSGRMNFTYSVDKNSSVIEVEMKGDFYKSDDTWKKRSSNGSSLRDFVESVTRKVHRDTDCDIKVTMRDKGGDKLIISEYDARRDRYNTSDY